ncbi:MAG: tyrosine-type recombinase/integrase [Clostridium sp.]|nr:tyrosine-type recombinase/integrase [Erysipelotrichaceae bacterium 66202529]
MNKSVSRVNKEFIVGTPKSNNSYRRIYINKSLKEIINRNLKSNLLFSINDTYVHYANVRSRLKTILKNTPYQSLTTHDLRHIHSSLLLHNKVDLKSISTHLGHSSIRITSDIYLHTTHEASEQLSLNIENIFNSLNNKPLNKHQK